MLAELKNMLLKLRPRKMELKISDGWDWYRAKAQYPTAKFIGLDPMRGMVIVYWVNPSEDELFADGCICRDEWKEFTG